MGWLGLGGGRLRGLEVVVVVAGASVVFVVTGLCVGAGRNEGTWDPGGAE